MKLRILFSRQARRDLDDIWQYSVANWGRAKADDYTRAISDTIVFVAGHPGLARDAGHIRPGLFRYVAGSHTIYFRWGRHEMRIVRIIHSSRDANRHL
jgi:toxin ParE1/3/4